MGRFNGLFSLATRFFFGSPSVSPAPVRFFVFFSSFALGSALFFVLALGFFFDVNSS